LKPKLSIIILTFNSIGFVKPCLESLLSQDYKDFEVIIIDNGSTDETVEFIKNEHPSFILIENKENLGAARARNQGINIAQGEWLLTLDCDVVLGKEFLSCVMELIEKLPLGVGMIQPKILQADKKRIYSCGVYLSWPLLRFYDIGKSRLDRGQFEARKYVFGVCSAAGFYRKHMLEVTKGDCGYFDEDFFFLFEDVDLSWRAQKNSFKAIYFPQAVCYHQGNSSSFKKPVRQYLCWRNRGLFLKKHKFNRLRLLIIFLMYDLPRSIFIFLTNPYARNRIIGKIYR